MDVNESTTISPSNIDDATKTPILTNADSRRSSVSGDVVGYRAAEAFIRPSPILTHGRVEEYGFDMKDRLFTLRLSAEKATPEDGPTICFLPEYHFPESHTTVEVSGGKWKIEKENVDDEGSVQIIKWWHSEGEQQIQVRGAVRAKDGSIMGKPEDSGNACQGSSNCMVM